MALGHADRRFVCPRLEDVILLCFNLVGFYGFLSLSIGWKLARQYKRLVTLPIVMLKSQLFEWIERCKRQEGIATQSVLYERFCYLNGESQALF